MKKKLRIILIVVLIVAVLGVALFFVFKKKKEHDETRTSISTMLRGEDKDIFDATIKKMGQYLNSDNTDDRVNIVLETNKNLDDIVWSLVSYYVKDETKIRDKEISLAYSEIKMSESLMKRMVDEYVKKVEIDQDKSVSRFNRHLGANDFFSQACYHLIKYANFVNLLNNAIRSNKGSDIRFNAFEVYANIVINSFGETKIQNNLICLKDYSSIDLINSKFKIDGIELQLGENKFSEEVNLFNKYYSNCDKLLFAKEFSTNSSYVTNSNQDTNEKIAMHYFKKIFNI